MVHPDGHYLMPQKKEVDLEDFSSNLPLQLVDHGSSRLALGGAPLI